MDARNFEWNGIDSYAFFVEWMNVKKLLRIEMNFELYISFDMMRHEMPFWCMIVSCRWLPLYTILASSLFECDRSWFVTILRRKKFRSHQFYFACCHINYVPYCCMHNYLGQLKMSTHSFRSLLSQNRNNTSHRFQRVAYFPRHFYFFMLLFPVRNFMPFYAVLLL